MNEFDDFLDEKKPSQFTLDLNNITLDDNKPREANVDKKFPLLKPDQYFLRCVKAELKTSKTGNKYLALMFKPEDRVKESMYEEDTSLPKTAVFHNFNIFHPNPNAKEFALRMLKTFAKSAEMNLEINNVDSFLDKRCKAFIDVEKNETYGDKNVIKYFIYTQDADYKY